jgi:DNA-binding NtrC family response regulator
MQDELLQALIAAGVSPPSIISSSSGYIEDRARLGQFSPELYALLGTVELNVPPLRQRSEDVPWIADYCLRHWAEGGRVPFIIEDEALAELQRYPWPANVAELVGVLAGIHRSTRRRVVSAARVRTLLRRRPQRDPGPAVRRLEEVECEYIRAAIARCRGNHVLAARRLGIGRSTLIRKLRVCRQLATPRSTDTPL